MCIYITGSEYYSACKDALLIDGAKLGNAHSEQAWCKQFTIKDESYQLPDVRSRGSMQLHCRGRHGQIQTHWPWHAVADLHIPSGACGRQGPAMRIPCL